MVKRLIICISILALLLALPFCLRPAKQKKAANSGNPDRVVVITAHNKSIRDEYSTAFKKYYLENFNREVEIDFRSPGGSSDIARYIPDRYEAEFRRFFESDPANGKWKREYAKFTDPALDRKNADPELVNVRKMFLNSNVGIGIDVFAGGGTFEHSRMAQRGFAVDGKVKERHPEYFKHIPAMFGGDYIYDSHGRYYGVVLSTFGICCNLDRIKELNTPVPRTWRDLADPRFVNCLSVADPSKSGSANKCFEILIQQQMAEAPTPGEGWFNGLAVCRRIFANSRSLTDSASKVVRDVATGNAVCGMAIDTYALSEAEWMRGRFDGTDHLAYITPAGGTAVSADPVQILRGSPNRIVAERFVDFLLSEQGQKLHAFKPGTPGGPALHSLNRPPVRQDIYDKKYEEYYFQKGYNPYKSGADFTYRPELTGRYYGLLRVLLKCTMLDAEEELKAAWNAIIAAGGPDKVPEAMKYFDALPFSYSEAMQISQKLRSARSGAELAAIYRQWSDFSRANLRKAYEIASGKGGAK